MARVFGRHPDRTAAIARSVSKHLEAGERVIAGVHVQSPGTTSAALAGAVAGALDVPPTISGGGSVKHSGWIRQANTIGIDPRTASRSIWMILVLTTRRLVLIRRSPLTRRTREVLAAWRLDEVEALRVPRNGNSAIIAVGGVALRLELPNSHKFLPDVYRDLPKLLQDARGDEVVGSAG